jgi:hypothetical protein
MLLSVLQALVLEGVMALSYGHLSSESMACAQFVRRQGGSKSFHHGAEPKRNRAV